MELIFVGDVGLIIENSKVTPWPSPFEFNSNLNARIFFNWELPLGDLPNPIPRNCGGPRLLAHPNSPRIIKNWAPGFAALATNHILDAEEQGLRQTIAALNDAGFITTGAGLNRDEIAKPLIWKTEEGTVAIINWVFPETHPDLNENSGPNCWPGIENAKKVITSLKSENDWVIVVAHWSDEYFPYPRSEDRNIAKELASVGLDLLIGHHPHVVRGMEIFNNFKVFYSLGNFYFSDYQETISKKPSKWAPRCREALGVLVVFKKGNIPNIELISFWQGDGYTYLDSRCRAKKRLISTSKPLLKLSDNNYEKWYRSQRSLFNKYWARWHFGIRKLGFMGSVDYIKEKFLSSFSHS